MCFLVWMFRIMQYKKYKLYATHIQSVFQKKLINEILQILQKQPFVDVAQSMCCWSFCEIHWERPVPESKKRLLYWCFPVNFAMFLRIPILQGISRHLLLTMTPQPLIALWWNNVTFQYLFDLPQVKRDLISSMINFVHELPYELPDSATQWKVTWRSLKYNSL